MTKKTSEPFMWLLFSVGGMLAALLIPILLLLLGVLIPLGWIPPPDYSNVLAALQHPLIRVLLLGFCVLTLFHTAHRLRFILCDGLQMTHRSLAITKICYGGGTVGSLLAGYILLRV